MGFNQTDAILFDTKLLNFQCRLHRVWITLPLHADKDVIKRRA